MSAEIQEQLIQTIMKIFTYTGKQANHLFKEIMMCVKRRDLVILSTIESVFYATLADHHLSHGRRIVPRYRSGHSQRSSA